MRSARSLVILVLAGCAPGMSIEVVRLKRHPVDASALQWERRQPIGLPRTVATNFFGPIEERCDQPPPAELERFTDYMQVGPVRKDPEFHIPAWAISVDEQYAAARAIAAWAQGCSLQGSFSAARTLDEQATGTCAPGQCDVIKLESAPRCLPSIVTLEAGDRVTPWLSARYRARDDRAGDEPEDNDRSFELGVDVDPQWTDGSSAIVVRYTCAPSMAKPLISFFHLSDAQIRDAKVKLGDEAQSRGLDRSIDSFEHDFEQELYIDLVLEAIVVTINRTLERVRSENVAAVSWQGIVPAFAIHTGDAVDAGTRSELSTFHSILDRLELPWLSAIGNHDVLTFGNLLPGAATSVRALAVEIDEDVPYLLKPFLWLAKRGSMTVPARVKCERRKHCEVELIATAAGSPERFIEAHRHGAGGPRQLPGTRDHGFDLQAGRPGYYRFEVPAGPYTLVGLVLNTSDFADVPTHLRGGAAGALGGVQLRWLEQELARTDEHQLVIVFGHHPLRTVGADSGRAALDRLLRKHAQMRGNLIAYVTGHTHEHDLRFQPAAPGANRGAGFWEIETASVIGFPQEQHLITIKQLDARVGFLELVPVRHTIPFNGDSTVSELLRRADRGAKRDHCRTRNKKPCIDGEPVRSDGDVAFARLFFLFPPQR